LKVCLVNTYHYRRGGDSTYTFDLAELLRARGHEVFHFAMKHRYNARCPQEEFFVDSVDYRETSETGGPVSRLRDFLRSLYSPEARRKFAALLDETQPDVVHLQNFRRHLTFSIVGAARERGIPVVFTAHDYDPVCPGSLLFAGGEVCEVCGGKYYYRALARRCKQGSLAGTAAVALESYFVRLMRYFNGIECIITPSAFARRKLIEYGFDPERVEVIHNFVHTDALEPSRAEGDYVLFFGRLAPEKGIDVLIDAAASVSGVRFVVAGEGPRRELLEARCARAGASNVEFIGYVDREDLVPLIRDSMFVVVPSICYENFPYNILESFALGKPVIGSDIGGIPEMVEHGDTGFLVPPHDVEGLAARIRELGADPALTREMGRRARERVEREFTADMHYKRLFEVYTRVTANRGAGG
jgi:glycosyltransferase involved in cell wall biosynthesis